MEPLLPEPEFTGLQGTGAPAAPADGKYSSELNMQGQIAGATLLYQLFMYMNNCLQFWYVMGSATEHCRSNSEY